MLYFGYSRRDELRLKYPQYSKGARAEMVRVNEAMTNRDRDDEEVFVGHGRFDCSRDGRARHGS